MHRSPEDYWTSAGGGLHEFRAATHPVHRFTRTPPGGLLTESGGGYSTSTNPLSPIRPGARSPEEVPSHGVMDDKTERLP